MLESWLQISLELPRLELSLPRHWLMDYGVPWSTPQLRCLATNTTIDKLMAREYPARTILQPTHTNNSSIADTITSGSLTLEKQGQHTLVVLLQKLSSQTQNQIQASYSTPS